MIDLTQVVQATPVLTRADTITQPGGLEAQCLRSALSHLVDLRNVMGVLQRRWPDTYHDGGEIRRMEEAIAQRLREVVRESEEARP